MEGKIWQSRYTIWPLTENIKTGAYSTRNEEYLAIKEEYQAWELDN
jgi:hypothetical protein